MKCITKQRLDFAIRRFRVITKLDMLESNEDTNIQVNIRFIQITRTLSIENNLGENSIVGDYFCLANKEINNCFESCIQA